MATKSTPSTRFDDIPGELPEGHVSEDVDYAKVAHIAIDLLNNLKEEDLAQNAIWRDFLSFTDTYRTFYSSSDVFETLQKISEERNRSDVKLAGTEPRLSKCGPSSWLDLDITFTLQDVDLTENCAGTVSVIPDSSGKWKIWMLRTWLEDYEGHGNPDHLSPANSRSEANGTANGYHSLIYDVIIAGGGQGGLGLAGRLKALGLSYIVFDKRPQIGDSWGQRYDSLKWHTIREYGNLPFGRTWNEDDETLLPAKRIGSGYKQWTEKFGINAQSGTSVDQARWDRGSQKWTVSTSGDFGQQEWRARNFVLCIGPGHKSPVSPEWASAEKIKASGFKGTIQHAFNYTNANAFAGKKGIVVGTANTAHDIASDMVALNMHTTMMQRNPTFIFPGEWLVGYHSHDYHLNKSTDQADREQCTVPNKIQREMANRIIHGLIKAYPERFDALEKAGFKVDRPGDLYTNLYIRYGGHYVDIGNVSRITSGAVQISSTPISRLTPNGLLLSDGTELEADLIVLATGFEHDFRKDAAEIVGEEVAGSMEDFWGVDSEGELRGFAKLAGHPKLYYHGTEARLARFFSRFVALQIQKESLGRELKPYLEGR